MFLDHDKYAQNEYGYIPRVLCCPPRLWVLDIVREEKKRKTEKLGDQARVKTINNTII